MMSGARPMSSSTETGFSFVATAFKGEIRPHRHLRPQKPEFSVNCARGQTRGMIPAYFFRMAQAHERSVTAPRSATWLVSTGEWLFRRRSYLPLPLAVALLTVTWMRTSDPWVRAGLGPLLVAAGEGLRLWSVRHIGTISRTRTDRLGPLVVTGPFQVVRNPLYLGNLLLWCGLALSAGLVWMLPVILAVLGFEYHAIVAWEESLLAARMGERYKEYAASVPRWSPTLTRLRAALSSSPGYSWRETFFSERGTILALAAGYLLFIATRWR